MLSKRLRCSSQTQQHLLDGTISDRSFGTCGGSSSSHTTNPEASKTPFIPCKAHHNTVLPNQPENETLYGPDRPAFESSRDSSCWALEGQTLSGHPECCGLAKVGEKMLDVSLDPSTHLTINYQSHFFISAWLLAAAYHKGNAKISFYILQNRNQRLRRDMSRQQLEKREKNSYCPRNWVRFTLTFEPTFFLFQAHFEELSKGSRHRHFWIVFKASFFVR